MYGTARGPGGHKEKSVMEKQKGTVESTITSPPPCACIVTLYSGVNHIIIFKDYLAALSY